MRENTSSDYLASPLVGATSFFVRRLTLLGLLPIFLEHRINEDLCFFVLFLFLFYDVLLSN